MLSAHAVCKTWRCQSSLEIKPILMAVLSGVAGLISYPWYGRDELWEVLRYSRPSRLEYVPAAKITNSHKLPRYCFPNGLYGISSELASSFSYGIDCDVRTIHRGHTLVHWRCGGHQAPD